MPGDRNHHVPSPANDRSGLGRNHVPIFLLGCSRGNGPFSLGNDLVGDHEDVPIAGMQRRQRFRQQRRQIVARFDVGKPWNRENLDYHGLSAVADGVDEDLRESGRGSHVGHPGVGDMNPGFLNPNGIVGIGIVDDDVRE